MQTHAIRYMEPFVITLMGGILPFGSIFIEMYFIFTSFWAYKIYYVFGFMLLVFLILTTVTVCVTIVCTYFLLNAEDYRWSVAASARLTSHTCVLSSFPANTQAVDVVHGRRIDGRLCLSLLLLLLLL